MSESFVRVLPSGPDFPPKGPEPFPHRLREVGALTRPYGDGFHELLLFPSSLGSAVLPSCFANRPAPHPCWGDPLTCQASICILQILAYCL